MQVGAVRRDEGGLSEEDENPGREEQDMPPDPDGMQFLRDIGLRERPVEAVRVHHDHDDRHAEEEPPIGQQADFCIVEDFQRQHPGPLRLGRNIFGSRDQ